MYDYVTVTINHIDGLALASYQRKRIARTEGGSSLYIHTQVIDQERVSGEMEVLEGATAGRPAIQLPAHMRRPS